MLTRYLSFSSLTICALLFACSNAGIGDIDREYLQALPVDFVTESGFQVVNLSNWDDETLAYEFDNRWWIFVNCMSNISFTVVRQSQLAKYIVLNVDRWQCSYHDWCGGEVYDSSIILGENLMFLEHEWLHWVFNLTETEVNNLKGICGVN